MLDSLKELRAEKGITQKQLGDAVGVTQQAINSYENSDTQPEYSTLIKLADFFNVSTDYILGHKAETRVNDEVIKYLSDEEDARVMKKYLSLDRKQKKVFSDFIDLVTDTGNSR
ncbi:MAG: helix-turn-helix transcriptional regulator [Anaerovoracaceae bacterium]|nr:helix-turn-helix transcriptional regulator [Bacillota bacterium]MDY2671384.1 helix-turn-helix transcriptional regulator [Anaerovoracaceae bacterium]